MLHQLSSGTNSSEIRLHNLSAILLMLLHQSGISRVQLAQNLKVSTATVTNLVNELVKLELVIEDGLVKTDEPQVGRPQRALRLIPEARHAVGIHIDVGTVHIALVDLQARPVAMSSFVHDVARPWEEVLQEASWQVTELIENSGINPAFVVGVGVAASGLVHFQNGVNVFAPNLNWHNVPIRDHLSETLKLPVVVDNNARAMALAESLFGAGQGVNALAFIYARMGVGAGLVMNGQLYRGAAAGAGEIGHTTVVFDGGEMCHCGNTGCLETLISEPVIVHLARQLAAHNPDGILAKALSVPEYSMLERIFNAVQSGDLATRHMLEERAGYMGVALANLVNIFNPDLIILGGIFRQEKSVLLPVVETVLRRRAFANLGEQVRVQTTTFGDRAGMIGAAALALDHFFYRPQHSTANARALFEAVPIQHR